MKNILFPTVRQGNCGDEFILLGVLNIIDSLQPEYNQVILNKNVEVCRRLLLRNKVLEIDIKGLNSKIPLNLGELCFKNQPLEDNSFADYYSLDFIDAVIFAGTPEWMVYKLRPLYEKLADYRGLILFLGPGYHEGLGRFGLYSKFSEVYRNIHKAAKAFIVRDRLLLDYMKPEVECDLLPCPALLCSKKHKARDTLGKIGFVLQAKRGDARVNYVSENLYYYSLQLLDEISKYYDVEVVCHWIEDLICLAKEVGDKYPVRYSYDAKDYLDIYDSYDLVVSTRVHGSGMAASLGIPTFTISHSMRTDTVKGFLSHVIFPDDHVDTVLDAIESLDIKEKSMKIISHKEDTLNAYKKVLSPFFPL